VVAKITGSPGKNDSLCDYDYYKVLSIDVRGGVGGVAAPNGLEKFQGKLFFQGKRKLL